MPAWAGNALRSIDEPVYLFIGWRRLARLPRFRKSIQVKNGIIRGHRRIGRLCSNWLQPIHRPPAIAEFECLPFLQPPDDPGSVLAQFQHRNGAHG